MRPIMIHRKRKHEAEQAVKDLEARGYKLVHPITPIQNGQRMFNRDKDNRYQYSHTTHSTSWMAKMEKVMD